MYEPEIVAVPPYDATPVNSSEFVGRSRIILKPVVRMTWSWRYVSVVAWRNAGGEEPGGSCSKMIQEMRGYIWSKYAMRSVDVICFCW